MRCVRLLPTRLRQASEQAARIAGSPITAGGHANGGAVHHERRRDHAQPRGQPTVVPRRTPTWRGRVAPSKMSANPVRAVRRPQLPCSERRPGRRRGRARRPALDPSQGEEPAPGQHPAAGRVLQVDVEAVVRATATVGSLADRTVRIYSDAVTSVPIAGGPRPLVRSAGWVETREAPQRIMSEAHRGAWACCVDPEGRWALQRPRSPLVP